MISAQKPARALRNPRANSAEKGRSGPGEERMRPEVAAPRICSSKVALVRCRSASRQLASSRQELRVGRSPPRCTPRAGTPSFIAVRSASSRRQCAASAMDGGGRARNERVDDDDLAMLRRPLHSGMRAVLPPSRGGGDIPRDDLVKSAFIEETESLRYGRPGGVQSVVK